MYRRRKASWMLDTALRFGVLIAAAVVVMTVHERWKMQNDLERLQNGNLKGCVMKEIQNYAASKYSGQEYSEVEKGIYQTKVDGKNLYLTSLSFVQEPEWGEGSNASEISQYPLEDLLDKYDCHITDFYEELNAANSLVRYLEFASPELDAVRNLREIIGKHVYNKEMDGSIRLIFE